MAKKKNKGAALFISGDNRKKMRYDFELCHNVRGDYYSFTTYSTPPSALRAARAMAKRLGWKIGDITYSSI